MRVTPKEIAQRLAADAERFARWLFPAGKMESGEWCVGSAQGEAGHSCKVKVGGAKAGIWCDFASESDKGDLLDLICAAKGVQLRRPGAPSWDITRNGRTLSLV